MGVGEFNGDGVQDLVVANASDVFGNVSVLINNTPSESLAGLRNRHP